ncbi:hypothetical protein Cni_G25099 [Canna indica]|uniref:6,7-dimethyl-8-ribityllumazine synthase n=1 Tax=Canna indica TaxID=4628 RepID=A0AAQ3KZH5_9LILI|nr:hypothetical protein Cni_G25099 [Canna indica]
MGNSLRCCLACVLPCGALDVIRVVHLNGHVEEYSRHISAGEVMAANPNHVLSKPCSQGLVRQILIVSPESELKRGNFYFLIPSSTLPPGQQQQQKKSHKRKRYAANRSSSSSSPSIPMLRSSTQNAVDDDDNYLTEILSEKRSHHRRRRSVARVGVWRPHLESICEDS